MVEDEPLTIGWGPIPIVVILLYIDDILVPIVT
jgi:hypothetical protein